MAEISFISAIIVFFVALFGFSPATNSEGQLSQPIQNGQQQQPTDTFKTYEKTINGTSIRIQVPSTWTVGSPASPRHIMVFDSPEVNSFGKHIAEIRVGVDDSPLSLNLTEYLNNEISTYQNNPDFGNFQLVYATADTHLSGYPAIFLGSAYTDSSTGIRYAAFEIGSFFNDNKFYFVYAAIDADQIANYLPQLQRILSSFQTSSEDIGANGVRSGEQGQSTNSSTQENRIVIPQGAATGLT